MSSESGKGRNNRPYGVDPDTGAVGSGLTDNNWFDPSGNGIKQLPSGSNAFTKAVYDGVGRQTVQYFGFDLTESSYAEASSVSDDTIVEQTETIYDDASNAIQTTFRQRFHNATGTGLLTSPGGAQPVARVTYVVSYPDALGRPQAEANYGTNGGAALDRAATIPDRADTALVDSTLYNSRGEAYGSVDPAGRVDQTTFDDAGRRTAQVLNVQASSSSSSSSSSDSLPASDDKNVTTLWTYAADGQIASLTAVNAATGDQTTIYGYGTSLLGSDMARNDVQASVTYPDGGIVTYLVNRQSQVKQFTDQRLVIHAYDFDSLGRQTEDRILSLGSSSSSSSSSSGTPLTEVDGTVQRISRTYDVRGLLENVTSHSSPIVGEGIVVNDVQRVYNSFEQLITEYQEHSGAVNTSTSVNVQYQYADGSSNTTRPTALVYPNGRVLHYDYGASGGIDDALGRIASLIDDDGATHLADYTRIGRDTFVEQSSPEPQIAWSLINGTGIDPYTGLDQFNRVVDNRWYSTATSADLDRIQHGYDRAGNRLWRKNTVAEAAGVYLDELYAHDGLYRLAEMQRGHLNGSNNGIVYGTLAFAQAWGLDATGNWSQFWQSDSGASWDLQQSRIVNPANEITEISGGWAQPAYDQAGNMVEIPAGSPTTPDGAIYDAWNRSVRTLDSGAVVQQSTFDGLMRRAAKVAAGSVFHHYYSAIWQALEVRVGTSSAADQQSVWGVRYIDDLVLCDLAGRRLHALHDPNWNTTAICDSSGIAVERYVYSAYGQPGFRDAAFAVITASANCWETLFGSYPWDDETKRFQIRHRVLVPSAGCWVSRDPLFHGPDLGAFANGALSGIPNDANLYAYVSGHPVDKVDPSGLRMVCGFYVWVYTGLGWCVDETVYQDAINAAGGVVTCWWNCEMDVHRCIGGRILTVTETVSGTLGFAGARIPKNFRKFLASRIK